MIKLNIVSIRPWLRCSRYFLFLIVEKRWLFNRPGFSNNVADFLNQLTGITEVTIDTRKTNICNLVNRTKVLYYTFADEI